MALNSEASLSPEPPASASSLRRKRRSKLQSRKNRKRRRLERPEELGARTEATAKYSSSAKLEHTAISIAKALLKVPLGENNVYSLDGLKSAESGFTMLEWDGRTTIQIVDSERRVIGILAGGPESGRLESGDWEQVCEEARQCLSEAKEDVSKEAECQHGILLCSGIFVGEEGGRPMNLVHSEAKKLVEAKLNNQSSFRRLAGFGSSIYASWMPDLFEHHKEMYTKLVQHDGSLSKPFRSVFTAARYTTEPRTAWMPDLNFANQPFGLCALTALGKYDSKKGGHLVLGDCKLVVEFPPGSTALIPSVLIATSILPVGENESWYSFMQFNAEGLSQWVDDGFGDLKAPENEEERKEMEEKRKKRWELAIDLFSKV